MQVQITVLDKNDSPPSFKDTPLHYSISEDLGPGQSVATVRADDPDTIGKLEYTLIRGDDGHFVLDKNTGVLSLVDSLDRETKDVYKLTVRASDGNQHTDTVLTVQVSVVRFYGENLRYGQWKCRLGDYMRLLHYSKLVKKAFNCS